MLRLMIILLICTVIGGCSGKERGEMMVVPSSGEREVDTESGIPESEDSEYKGIHVKRRTDGGSPISGAV